MSVKEKNTAEDISKMYDQFAPVMYGKILAIVHKGPIADKVLQQVFVNAFKNKDTFNYTLRSPFMTLLNQSRDKSYKTMKALNIFRECCEGTSISIPDTISTADTK